MTNEEAICVLYDSLGGRQDSFQEAFYIAINSIQENAKLKAEINRPNGKSEMYRDMADSFCNSNIKLKAEIEQLKDDSKIIAKELVTQIREIEQLKSELEHLVKLPCTCNNCKYADFMGVESKHFYCMNHKHYMNVGGYCSFGEKEEPWQTAERTGIK